MKLSLFFVLFCYLVSSSQTREIEDGMTSIKAISEKPQKSFILSIASSAILPGIGHWYLGNQKTAIFYTVIDAFTWFSLTISLFSRNSQLQNTRSIGSHYGGINLSHKSEQFLRKMTQYRSYLHQNTHNESYEYFQNLQGISPENFDIPNSSENYWDFGPPSLSQNTENWNKFIHSFQNYERTKIFTSWTIGGLILLRVLSVIHTIHNYRQRPKEKTILSSTQVIPLFTFNRIGLVIESTFSHF